MRATNERIRATLLSAAATLLVAIPGAAQHPATGHQGLFATSDRCMACHNGLVTPSGEDVSIGIDWRASMMANAARDPYWHAAVRRESIDHPDATAAIENECATCHMPMAQKTASRAGGQGEVFAHLPAATAATPMARLAVDGASCTTCHQIRDENLGTRESFVGGFTVDTLSARTSRTIYGPFQVDPGRETIMSSAVGFRPTRADHIQSSEVCATCHTLYTHALGDGGEVIGELPEQVPYLEWRHSGYSGLRSCASCHMPVVRDSVAVSSVMGPRRKGVNRHSFRGANFFMTRLLNANRAEFGVAALPGEMTAAVARTIDHLETRSATILVEALEVEDGRLTGEIAIENHAGHKLPTAYPSRRAWLHVTVRNADGRVIFESGAIRSDGSITGNDNDAHGDRYEPHHAVLSRPGDVVIYEAIMVGPDDEVTTGLLTAVGYVKDNRLLPRGFDVGTAGPDIAVRGRAVDDVDFGDRGDRVRLATDVDDADGPFTVEAELWYQPIAFRWARNLTDYDSAETNRFVELYEAMSDVSGVILARDVATTR